MKTKLIVLMCLAVTIPQTYAGFQDDGAAPESAPISINTDAIVHETDLVNVTSDGMDGSLLMKVMTTDENALLGLKYVASGGEIKEASLSDLAKGWILKTEGPREVLKLTGDLNPVDGGNLDLRYLHDGVWNIYKIFPIHLTKSGTQWTMETREPNKSSEYFNSMFLKVKKLFGVGREIGIEKVIVSQK